MSWGQATPAAATAATSGTGARRAPKVLGPAKPAKAAEVTSELVGQAVKIEGKAVDFQAARSDRAPNSFSVQDASGKVAVVVWNDAFKQIPGADKLGASPNVTVEGEVSEYRGKIQVRVSAPEQVKIQGAAAAPAAPAAHAAAPAAPAAKPAAPASSSSAPAPAGATKLAEVTSAMEGQDVLIVGNLKDYKASRSERAPHSFVVKDDTGQVRVTCWPDSWPKVKGHEKIESGAAVRVSVKGKVAVWKGNAEVQVKDGAGIEVLGDATSEAPAAAKDGEAALAPAAVTNALNGQVVTIEGKVLSARRPTSEKAPYMLRVGDASAAVDVVFWKATAEAVPAENRALTGDTVRIVGKVGEHRGTVQVQLQGPESLLVKAKGNPDEEPAKPADPEPGKPVALAGLQSEALGNRVRVAGKVEKIEPVRLGRKIVVSQSGAEATVLFWDTARGLAKGAEELKAGSQLEIDGELAEAPGVGRVVVVRKATEVVAVTP